MNELSARVHALIAQWRATSAETREHHDMSKWQSRVLLPKHSERTIATLRRCADELEAALDAALAAALAPKLKHEAIVGRLRNAIGMLRYHAREADEEDRKPVGNWYRQYADVMELAAAALAPQPEKADE